MLKKISDFKFQIEKTGAMLVPGIIYGSEKTISSAGEQSISQVMNVAGLAKKVTRMRPVAVVKG